MSTKKQYKFYYTKREAFDGRTWPDYESETYKSVRKAEQAMYEFDSLPGVKCGGTASMIVRRVR